MVRILPCQSPVILGVEPTWGDVIKGYIENSYKLKACKERVDEYNKRTSNN